MIIDTHAHIYNKQFDHDFDNVLSAARENHVDKILMPNIDLATLPLSLALAEKHPGVCYPMLGLHPCDVLEDYETVLNELYTYFDKYSFVAVGEIGLDLYHDKSYTTQQVEAFHVQIGWATEKNLPINIHSRNANEQSISIVSEYKSKGLKGVFHCFSGTLAQAQEMVSLGFYLGIGGVVTFKNSGLDAILKAVGVENIVLETDAPFLAPAPHRGKRNEPAYLSLVADKLSAIFELTSEEIQQITTSNAKKVFNL